MTEEKETKIMSWPEYAEAVKGAAVPGELQFGLAVMWLHPERLPMALVSVGETKAEIIRVPAYVKNKYGLTVPVIAVRGGAFGGNETVTDVILPSGIERLPQDCFAGCTALRNITIPKRIKTIPQGCFDGCTHLENVYYEGTPQEWRQIDIVHEKHEIEFGGVIPGTSQNEIAAERLVHVPGNDALFTANIHFRCGLEQSKNASFVIGTGGKDITNLFRTT